LPEKITKNFIYEILKVQKSPVNVRTLLNKLKLSKKFRLQVKRILQELVREGKIQKERKKYFAGNFANTITGKVDIKNGFGYLINRDGEDIYIGKRSANNLLPGDEIEAFITKGRNGKNEAIIKNILHRTKAPLMCRVKKVGKNYFALLTFKDYPVIKLKESNFNIKDGDIILVNVEEKNGILYGEVLSLISDRNNIDVLEQFILDKNEIRQEFPKEVIKEAEKINMKSSEIKNRIDLRDETIITVDPIDAKDFDDAISIVKKDEFYELGVHIADVSYYVNENSAIDNEAYLRGVSVYLPERAIPMLPEKLSNDICSLREGEDRLTFSIFMKIGKSGEILSYEIKESIINNKKRFNYEEVQNVLDGLIDTEDDKIKALIITANELKENLKNKLYKDGMIDFSIGEPSFLYDPNGEIYNIIRKETLESHKIIEFFMIYANICAADFISKNFKKGIFRIHPAPSEKDIKEFNVFLNATGMNFKLHKGTNKEFQEILKNLENSSKSELIKKRLLRSMQLARYSEKNTGHFGLALRKYTHFTSPIRRYADIVCHRLIKHSLKIKEMKNFDNNYLKDVSYKITECEERAEKAEGEVFKLYALNFLKSKIGEEFYAIITKITKNGFFVEFEKYPVEGFINFDNIYDDYYEYDYERQAAFGLRTKKQFKIGTRVKVVISQINLEFLKMNLELVK